MTEKVSSAYEGGHWGGLNLARFRGLSIAQHDPAAVEWLLCPLEGFGRIQVITYCPVALHLGTQDNQAWNCMEQRWMVSRTKDISGDTCVTRWSEDQMPLCSWSVGQGYALPDMHNQEECRLEINLKSIYRQINLFLQTCLWRLLTHYVRK